MWPRISLRYRLNLLFAALLLLWLAVDVGRILIEAGPRARAEDESVTRLTSEFVNATLPRIEEAPEPDRALAALVAELQNLRHVRVTLGVPEDVASAPALVSAADANSHTPAWFRATVDAPPSVSTIPVIVHDRHIGSLFIVADPSDEIDEVWSAAVAQIFAGGVLAITVLFASSIFIRLALKPLGSAGLALARLEAGDYDARTEPEGSPEFVAICHKINRLAEALSNFSSTNLRLIDRLFDAQDDERKMIAHELHDEIGPHLFALRAKAAMLAARVRAKGDEDSSAAAAALCDQVEALQGHNRRILAQLRPVALEEYGLLEALRILVDQWRKTEPAVTLVLSASDRIADLGQRASLMAYRFVQEALTNAFRHSGARQVDVTLAYASGTAAEGSRDPALAGLRISIRDDGRGLAEQAPPSLGLLGMRERVRALGGAVAIGRSGEGGAIVEAIFGASA
jgi:two-component system, NarL family, sensor histidine kinase UhpB